MFEDFKSWKKNEIDKFNPKGSKGRGKGNTEKSKLIRKLKHKTKYLEIEYEDAKELLEEAKSCFFNAIRKFLQDNPDAENPLRPTEIEKNDNQKRNLSNDEVKSIYREIVKATHPDKNPGEEEEAKQMFVTASEAKQKNKIEDLINISFDLDIDLSDISIELIEDIEKSLEKKESKIEKMSNDIAVKWFRSSDESQLKIIKSICPIKKK